MSLDGGLGEQRGPGRPVKGASGSKDRIQGDRLPPFCTNYYSQMTVRADSPVCRGVCGSVCLE